MSSWYRRTADGWLLAVHAQPGAKKSACAGLHGDSVKIRVAAPPAEGRANAALVAFLAAALGVPRRSITIVRGQSSREKHVLVADARADPARLLGDKT